LAKKKAKAKKKVAKKKTAKKSKRMPIVGGVYLSPLSSPGTSPGALGEGYFGAVRVLRVIERSALVATTTWLSKDRPNLDDPALRETVINNRFLFRNDPSRRWLDAYLPEGLELLGVLEPTAEEARLECNVGGGGWYDHCAQDVLLQWRWENDREAFEAEVEERRNAPQPPRPTKREHKPMALKAFWNLIALLDWTKTGDDDAVIKPLVEALAKHPVKDIIGFEERLADLLYALDGEVYAREIGEGAYKGPGSYLSADWFLYVRLCAVAGGEALYREILRDPRAMPKDVEFESLLYVAGKAYELKTGEYWEGHSTFHDYETFSNKEGWRAPDEDEATEPSDWVRLQLSDAKSDKYWEIRVSGASHKVHWGRTGTEGRRKTTTFASNAEAQADADRLIRQKTKKGYQTAGE